MSVLRRNQFNKQPSEEYPIDINFAAALPLGATKLVSANISAVKWPRRETTNIDDATLEILISTTGVIVGVSDTKVRFFIKGGTNNYEYKITVIGTFDNGAILEENLYMRVREE